MLSRRPIPLALWAAPRRTAADGPAPRGAGGTRLRRGGVHRIDVVGLDFNFVERGRDGGDAGHHGDRNLTPRRRLLVPAPGRSCRTTAAGCPLLRVAFLVEFHELVLAHRDFG